MKLKLDEHLPVDLLADLTQAGHDADSVLHEGLAGASDDVVMAAAQAAGRCLFTMDKGIANITRYPPTAYFGIVLFRPRHTGRGEVLRFVRSHLPAVMPQIAPGLLIVVSEHGIRVR